MSFRKQMFGGLVACVLLAGLTAEAGTFFGEVDGKILATNGNRIVLIDESGGELWSYKGKNCHDIWKLDNGNILFADEAVHEVNPATNEEVFTYTSAKNKGGGAFSCQRLENGNTLIGENSTGRVLEVDKAGTVVFELKVEPFTVGNHHNLRMVRKLDNGNYLVCHSKSKFVREYTPKGEVVFEVMASAIAMSAVRLPNGNTIIGGCADVVEYDSNGTVVWRLTKKDLKGFRIAMMCGVNVLPNNNLLIGVYGASHAENGAGMLEVTRDKKVVWRFVDLEKKKGHFISAIKLSADGKALSKLR